MATKTILLLRHGHSEANDSVADKQRPLSGQGRRDARRLGGLLRRLDLTIDLALSSPALRARQTAALAAGGNPVEVRAEPRLYEAKAEGYLEVLRSLPARAGCVLLVGHNPAIRQAAAALLACGPEAIRCPPAALACLEAPVEDWAALQAGSCALLWLLPPELLAPAR